MVKRFLVVDKQIKVDYCRLGEMYGNPHLMRSG